MLNGRGGRGLDVGDRGQASDLSGLSVHLQGDAGRHAAAEDAGARCAGARRWKACRSLYSWMPLTGEAAVQRRHGGRRGSGWRAGGLGEVEGGRRLPHRTIGPCPPLPPIRHWVSAMGERLQ